ncbi:EamA family transporter [Caryophanon latum]|uniref:EamA family transporter n=1 Tax=Caryophanon latum TaxID=33977 RepID=UPI000A003215
MATAQRTSKTFVLPVTMPVLLACRCRLCDARVWQVFSLSMQDVPFLFILGIINTALGFSLFFVGLEHLSGQRSAMLSYTDPLSAIIISAVILNEPMRELQLFGRLLLLGATAASEITWRRDVQRQTTN